MKIISIMTLISALLLAGNSAFSQEIDINQLQQKLQAVTDEEFKSMDKDGDGKISQSEYTDFVLADAKVKAENSFKSIDQNNDGVISKDEYDNFLSFATNQLGQFMNLLKQQPAKQAK